MMYPLLILISSLALAWMSPLNMVAQTPPAQTAPAVPEEPRPVLAVPEGYRYDPQGRRDPFVNPIPEPTSTEPEVPVNRPPGLRGLLLNEAVIAGIAASKQSSTSLAVIQAPGNKTYFAARNDVLFDAVVKDIQLDAVVFALTVPGRPGEAQVPPREIVRKVRTSGENQ
jgi:hypothetical protein